MYNGGGLPDGRKGGVNALACVQVFTKAAFFAHGSVGSGGVGVVGSGLRGRRGYVGYSDANGGGYSHTHSNAESDANTRAGGDPDARAIDPHASVYGEPDA